MALSLEDQIRYQQGDKVEDADFLKGRSLDVWIKPILSAEDYPTVITLGVATNALVGATSISLTASSDVTLYRNDVLKFTGGLYAVVKATTTVTDDATTVPVYPLDDPIPANAEAKTYGMLPLVSAKEGAYPQPSASYAEAHNKNMGWYAVSQKIREDYTATISGDLNFKDPCLEIFQQMQTSGLSKLLIQARHAITTEITIGATTYTYGEGPGAVQYKGQGTVTLSDPEAGMIGFSMEVKISGKIDDYLILNPA